ncbi:type VI secretion system baseplate subunit TssK [Pendulispora brunnea]|uniref:Type VI secretion system baseplate subunit TssK n=1 Tax=Pendulispora brunnea TaxID=2905690 RepID=A0ABZ2KHM4_9BACT
MLMMPLWRDDVDIVANHFQAAIEYHKRCVQHERDHVNTEAWGIDDIEIDVSALARGRVDILRLNATFPDISEVIVGPGDIPLTGRLPDLSAHGSVIMHVALPKLHPSRANALPAGTRNSSARYEVEEHDISDFENGRKPVRAPFLRPNVRLLSDQDQLDRFDTLPCVRITRDRRGKPILDRSFVPPIWRVRASAYLIEQLEKLSEGLLELKTWADNWNAPADLLHRRTQLRRVLGESVEWVADILDRPLKSPRDAHLQLAVVLQSLAVFTPRAKAPLPPRVQNGDGAAREKSLPAFEHFNLTDTFSGLFAALDKVVAEIAEKKHLEIPLPPVPEAPWARHADLSKEGLLAKEFYLAISGSDLEQLRKIGVPELIKIGPLDKLVNMKYATSRGVPLHWTAAPPKLPQVRGVFYFQIDKSSPIWAEICHSLSMGLQYDHISGITNVVLYAVDSENK